MVCTKTYVASPVSSYWLLYCGTGEEAHFSTFVVLCFKLRNLPGGRSKMAEEGDKEREVLSEYRCQNITRISLATRLSAPFSAC